MTSTDYGIVVKFRYAEGWSREFTYLHSESVEPDTVVLVPSNDGFVSVARVKRSVPNYEQLPDINYKRILQVTSLKAF